MTKAGTLLPLSWFSFSLKLAYHTMESSNIAVIQPDMFERNTESYEEGEELTDGSEREVLISLLSL